MTGFALSLFEGAKPPNPSSQSIRLKHKLFRGINQFWNQIIIRNLPYTACVYQVRRGPQMIESYDFGRIVIDGKQYGSDVLVFPHRVMSRWWRKEGHRLHINDLEEVVKEGGEVLIVGTGYSGLMDVLTETKESMRREGFELIIRPTREACETYNNLVKSGKKVIAALHLTC
ncbi:MAG: MTH938/NDUFAF3 family protein [Candidatus Bathyarchaeota archaeon]|nr:MTH938/NDUFAF3 family protein [Candidatus Bathyarchaeota archaeon]